MKAIFNNKAEYFNTQISSIADNDNSVLYTLATTPFKQGDGNLGVTTLADSYGAKGFILWQERALKVNGETHYIDEIRASDPKVLFARRWMNAGAEWRFVYDSRSKAWNVHIPSYRPPALLKGANYHRYTQS